MNNKGFTFVELIIVVTILVILSTIGFISYNGYIVGVRDTSRISQLTNLKDALNVYSIKNILPLPEDSVEVKNGTEIIAYQGYLGKSIIDNIGYSTQGIDPKDKQYYSYYLTSDKKYFQLLGFLEESESLGAFNLVNKVHANINRYPYTAGSRLGIMTDTNNTPIQELEAIKTVGEIDILNVGSTLFKSFLSGKEYIETNGTGFLVLKDIARVGGKKWNIENNGFVYGGDVQFTGSSSGGGVVISENSNLGNCVFGVSTFGNCKF
ncbi:MAG: prepilin-type N-terminal cleavage/methylation domain-containing protein [Candidatus Gracilibacteria bacterium]|nr:prepilin-type N-terminal cleavage/methylation domain-containing protein [Candidatus Gracilibacteria bacterium]